MCKKHLFSKKKILHPEKYCLMGAQGKIDPLAGLGIVPDLYRCDTPPGGGRGAKPIIDFPYNYFPQKKIDFPYNNFPKKAISLRKCTKKKIKKSPKKNSRLRRAIPLRPPRGVRYRISSIPAF